MTVLLYRTIVKLNLLNRAHVRAPNVGREADYVHVFSFLFEIYLWLGKQLLNFQWLMGWSSKTMNLTIFSSYYNTFFAVVGIFSYKAASKVCWWGSLSFSLLLLVKFSFTWCIFKCFIWVAFVKIDCIHDTLQKIQPSRLCMLLTGRIIKSKISQNNWHVAHQFFFSALKQ